MKITKVTILAPHTGQLTLGNSSSVGVRIYTDEGIYGDGEVAGINTSWACFGMLRDLAPMIIGRNPLDNEAIWDDIYRTGFCGLNGGQTFFAGLGAIDLALWDIKGKFFNVPVYQLLGGKKWGSRLRAYASQLQGSWDMYKDLGDKDPWSVTARAPEEYARNARHCVEMGYDCVKLDFCQVDIDGRYFNQADWVGPLKPRILHLVEDRVAAVREAIGPDVDLIMENHAHLDVKAAVQVARACEKYNIMYFEEPTTPSAKLTKYVHDNINIPIAHGERIISRWDYIPYFEDGSIQMIQPDLGNCGGITEVKKICDMAYAYGIGVQIHVCGSHLMTPPALHLEAALPNFIIHEQHILSQSPGFARLTSKTFDAVDGYMEVPEAPGMGIEWSEEALACEDQITIQ